ncbi:melanoma-associated antigen D2-like [Corticium candelabrum]|uniref:melanoma-associated antigen D2-like n=1 Tax=Corticium candelabrum TaxID=121492 RepID=UPI002E26F1D0|nr:melanoma-associated antigen D2-like [Corticium candelabrum]
MARQKAKARKTLAIAEENEFNETQEQDWLSQLGASQGQSRRHDTKRKKVKLALSEDEQNRKACELVRYMISVDHQKYPVRRTDLIQVVMKDYADGFPVVLEAAREKMKMIFGLDIVELKARSSKFYILVNLMYGDAWEEAIDRFDGGSYDCSELGLLSVILALIFMNHGSIDEPRLWHVLMSLQIEKCVNHEVFGQVHKLMDKFVKQLYLDSRKVTEGDAKHTAYEWGARAKEELDPEIILNFVADMQGVDPIVWRNQYEQQLSRA